MLFSFYSLRGDTNLGLFLASNLVKLASLIFLIGAPPTLDTCMSLVWGSSGKVMQMRQHDLRLKDACKSANTGTAPRNVAVRGSPPARGSERLAGAEGRSTTVLSDDMGVALQGSAHVHMFGA